MSATPRSTRKNLKRGATRTAAAAAAEPAAKRGAAVGYPSADAVGGWYPGRVTSIAKNKLTVAVEYDDGGVDGKVPWAHVEWTRDGYGVGARVSAWWPEAV